VVELQNLDFMFSPLMGDYLISRRYIDGNLNSCWIYACYMSFFSLLFFFFIDNLGCPGQRSVDTRTSTNPKGHATSY
jgi:hypothetical protein